MRSLVRIASGLVFMSYGTMKLFNVPASGMRGYPVSLGTQIGVAATLEVFGGLLIVLGLLTRPVAFLLSGEMAVAYFQVHAPRSPWPALNQGTAAVLFCFWYLYLAVAGPGPWSLDAMIARARRR
jgi:putative oxidoreductase